MAKLNLRLKQKRQKSGQVIIIAVLAMALILLSTQIYVFNVDTPTFSPNSDSLSDYLAALKLGSRNVVAGSLANISNGGANSILAVNLDRWETLVNSQNQFGRSTLTYEKGETSPYSSGIWLSWGTQGNGVSSSTVNFSFSLSDYEVDADLSYAANVTTRLSIQGTYQTIGIIQKRVTVTINVYNEGSSVLATQITVFYRELGTWMEPTDLNNYVLTDYGNGTYLASFDTYVPMLTVDVSVHAVDGRGILAQADTTCALV